MNNPSLSIPVRQRAWLAKLFHRNSRRTGFQKKVLFGKRVHVHLPPQLRAGNVGSAALVTLENDLVVCRDALTNMIIICISALEEEVVPYVHARSSEEATAV